MKRRRPVIVFIAALAVHSRAQVSESALPIEVTVPVAPIPVRGAGASHVFYELHLTNFRTAPLELTRLEVHAGAGGETPLASYTGEEISSRLRRPGLAAMRQTRVRLVAVCEPSSYCTSESRAIAPCQHSSGIA